MKIMPLVFRITPTIWIYPRDDTPYFVRAFFLTSPGNVRYKDTEH